MYQPSLYYTYEPHDFKNWVWRCFHWTTLFIRLYFHFLPTYLRQLLPTNLPMTFLPMSKKLDFRMLQITIGRTNDWESSLKKPMYVVAITFLSLPTDLMVGGLRWYLRNRNINLWTIVLMIKWELINIA